MLLNQWIGAGRLGRDPEMTYTPTGKAVTKCSIAVDQGKEQATLWLNVVAWERLAERVATQMRKGQEVLVQGRLTMRLYKDKNGVDRQALEITATMVQLTQRPQATTEADGLGDLEDHPF